MDYVWFLFRFEGIGRARYWLATLAILCGMIFMLVSLVKLAIACGVHGSFSINLLGISTSIRLVDGGQALTTSWFFQIMAALITYVFAWSYAAVSIKRLRDRNKSGWWIVPFIVAPGVYIHLCDTTPFIGLAIFIAFIWGFIELACLRGTRGPNRFGPDPLAPAVSMAGLDQQGALQRA
jgi:uncharacterized membrane protein YhaH (DUF805 family)